VVLAHHSFTEAAVITIVFAILGLICLVWAYFTARKYGKWIFWLDTEVVGDTKFVNFNYNHPLLYAIILLVIAAIAKYFNI
jgi:hypothetical protein